MAFKKLIGELHRRSIWQVLAAYAVFSWLLFETFEMLRVAVGLPAWVEPTASVILVLLLPAFLATASIQKGRPAPWPRLTTEPKSEDVPDAEALAADPLAGAAAVQTTWDPAVSPRPGARPVAATTPPAPPPRRIGATDLLTWRNTLLGGVGAFLLLAVFTAGYMVLRTLGIGPAGTLVAQGTLDEREQLILADFASPADMSELARAITDGLRVDLAQSPVVRLHDQRYVSAALDRMELEPDATLDLQLAREVALREAVRAVVGGEIRRVGSRYVLTGEVVAAEDGSVLVSRRATARDTDDLVGAVDELSKALRERIGEPLRSIGRADPLERVTTANLDALRRYSSAVRAIDMEGAQDRGIALLEEAVQLDADFAMAWRKLGIALSNRSEERARIVEALTQAYEKRDRLTARERDLATAAYHSTVADDLPTAIAAYENLLSREPDEGAAVNNLGVLRLEQRQYEAAIPRFERALEIDSLSTIPFMNLIWAHANTGDFEAARRHIEAYPWLAHDPTAKEHLAQLRAARGEYAEAMAALQTLRDDEVASPYWQAQTNIELAGLAAVRGRVAESERFYRDAMALNERRRLSRQYLVTAAELAQMHVWIRGAPAAAAEILDAAVAQHPLDELGPLDRPSLELAEAYALAGRARRARGLLDGFEADVAPELRGAPQRIRLDRARGAVALAEGNATAAVEAFRAADRGTCIACSQPLLAHAYEIAGQPDSAIAAYERYLSTPYLWRARDDAWHLPRAHDRLAALYEEGGDPSMAAEHFAQLARLWDEADEELQARVERARDRAGTRE
jgi:tetratricopeptide (TPR) repeat protein